MQLPWPVRNAINLFCIANQVSSCWHEKEIMLILCCDFFRHQCTGIPGTLGFFWKPTGRDSGNDFRIPEIASNNSRFSFNVFFRSDTERASFLVIFLGTTRNEVVSFWISKKQETTKVVSTISAYRALLDFNNQVTRNNCIW